MARAVTFKITGGDEIRRRIEKLTHDLQEGEVRKAMRKGFGVVRDAARKNAKTLDDPATATSIARNIAMREDRRAGRRLGAIVLKVGVRGGARQTKGEKAANPGGDTFYWRFHEFGTRKMRARPFLRPALAQNAERAIDETARELDAALDRLTVPPKVS